MDSSSATPATTHKWHLCENIVDVAVVTAIAIAIPIIIVWALP